MKRTFQIVPALLLCCGAALQGSDTLLLHGHIYTGSSSRWAQALSITGGKIDAIGSDQNILTRKTASTKVIDLRGKTVIPGIIDGHVHMWFGALALDGLNLSTPDSNITPDDESLFIEKLKAYASSRPRDPILYARAAFRFKVTESGYSPVTRHHETLDKAVPDRPLVIHDTSEHALWVNQKALALAGITSKPLADAVEDKYVERNADGSPTGIVREAAMERIERCLPVPPMEQRLALLRKAERYLNSYGITRITMATGSLAEMEPYGILEKRGELTLHVRTAFGAVAVNHHLTPQFLADLEKARTTYHDDWVSGNVVKFFADGIGAPPLYQKEDYKQIVTALDKRGYQVITHSLDEVSSRMVLDTYQAIEKENGHRDRRYRMEHADVLSLEDVPRFGALSVIASMQPSFCCYAFHRGPAKNDMWKSLEDSGATLAFSSDWPCTWPPDPFRGMQSATTRQIRRRITPSGPVGDVKYDSPEERISLDQAIQAYTKNAAFAAFADTKAGTLETGKLADLVVLSQDPFSAPTDKIGATQAVLTMVQGKIVFDRQER
jgi:predicted amidohydrolase YtcJ